MKSEKTKAETEFNKTKLPGGFDSLLLVLTAILFIASVASAFQLNELNEKVASFEQPVVYQQSSGAETVSTAPVSDEEILAKLNQAPDMVGGC